MFKLLLSVSKAITPNLGNQELQFLGSIRHQLLFNICVRKLEQFSSYRVDTIKSQNLDYCFQFQRAITPINGNPKLRFLHSAYVNLLTISRKDDYWVKTTRWFIHDPS